MIEQIGPYRIDRELGRGGMGVVYLARDTRLDRDVAIKVLPAHLAGSAEFKQRFEREAKSISQLSHPHICTLHDIGHHDGTDYLVMELLDGETLAERLRRSPLTLEETLRYGSQIASALAAAHARGVIHRDLKPGNVMLTKSGAKLLDFGLAKPGGALDERATLETMTQPLTSKGTLIGTFQYMAPEQLEGKEVDARTDIFTFGAMLYEMATGRRAFEGDSQASLIASIMSAQPRPLREMQPLTPQSFDRLVRKCLAKDPDDRRQSAADIADELRWISESGSQEATTPAGTTRRNRWLPAALVGLPLLILAVVLTLIAWRPQALAPPTQLSVALPAGDTLDAGLEAQLLAISQDGRTLAYCARRDGVIRLYVRPLGEREARALPGTEDAHNPFFSPDGRWVAFFQRAKLMKVSTQGGPAITICGVEENRSGVWLKDDTIVFAPGFATGLARVPAAGGTYEMITQLDTKKRERTHRWPDALPSGEWVCFTVGTTDSPGSYDDANIEAVSLKTGERKVLVHGGCMARWAASGHLVYARDGVLFALPVDPASATILGDPTPVVDRVASETTSGAMHFAIAGNGTLAYVSKGSLNNERELVWVDRNGKIEVIPAPLREYRQPRVSTDGNSILVTIGPGYGRGDIWCYNLRRQTLTRLTFGEINSDAHWVPGQERMIYCTDSAPRRRIMSQALDESSPEQVIYQYDGPVAISSVTPDGKAVLCWDHGSLESNIWMVPVDGNGDAIQVVDDPGEQYAAVVSPDGDWVAYASGQLGGGSLRMGTVFVRSFQRPGGKQQVSTDLGSTPLWSPDGKELFYTRGTEVMSVPIQREGDTLMFGVPTKLFDAPPQPREEPSFRPFDLSPDGSRFLFVRSANPELHARRLNVVLNWFTELNAKSKAQ